MYATSKNSFQKKAFLSQMCIICLHLTQRFLTTRFFAGLFTGILFTVIFYQGKEPKEGLKFRPDQSKFEYQDNQYASADVHLSEASIWNHTWDSLKQESTHPRHLYLIRHGQYFDDARTAQEMKLTALGKEQLVYTGKRLNDMKIPFDRLIHSGMVRAVESATIINEQLDSKLELFEDKNLTEGLPVAPIPYAGISQKDVDLYGDRVRIDTAFATYFHRAHHGQKKETHDILVFHANILRYFICKIMQFPVQAWLRITLNHGSITRVTILSDGNVVLQSVGDGGFIPSDKATS